jgi:hypothetical protein
MACCRDGSPTAPTTGAPGVLRCSLAERIRLDARIVGATRCVALVRSCTTVPHHLRCPPATAPPGDPPGRPYIARRQGAGRSSERTESCRLFPTKQQRNASPRQGEAGAQRRVRVDPVVVRPHDPGCPPPRPRRATHRVAPTLPAGRVQDRVNHARSHVA